MNSGFKLIAIKTGQYSENSSFKVLNENTIYSFYKAYSFPDNNFEKINYNQNNDICLYKIKGNKLSVNISAIVGKNGSGKSSLLELLYLANYNIGCHLELLYDYDKDKHFKEIVNLSIELFYCLSNTNYFNVRIQNGSTKVFRYSDKLILGDEVRYEEKKDLLSHFFYSIVVNYSHHSLNTEEIGDWIRPLFHKNDGYQTPIVLNPMRTKGNFNINKENALLSRRLHANLLEPVRVGDEINSLRNVSNGKIAKELLLTYKNVDSPYKEIKDFLEERQGEINHNTVSKATGNLLNVIRKVEEPLKLPKKLYTAINNVFKLSESDDICMDDKFKTRTLAYVDFKLNKVVSNYKQYERFKIDLKNEEYEKILSEVEQSRSHIFFKVKGAILYLKYFKRLLPNYTPTSTITISINELSQTIQEIKNTEGGFINTYMLCPPAFFDIETRLENDLKLGELSSGEKQQIHSINSIIYHLIFLNSVEKRGGYEKFNNVNIVIDEIELYFHPEWQRTYINDLLKTISLISNDNVNNIDGINILISTHSPFILSDIPSSNILFLEKKEGHENSIPQDIHLKTFGANIHDMLRHGFFMNNGTMGEYAKKTVNDIIVRLNYVITQKTYLKMLNENFDNDEFCVTELDLLKRQRLKYVDLILSSMNKKERIIKLYKIILNNDSQLYKRVISKEEIERFISIIGEPILKNKLSEMYNEAFGKEKTIEERISELARRGGYNVSLKRIGE